MIPVYGGSPAPVPRPQLVDAEHVEIGGGWTLDRVGERVLLAFKGTAVRAEFGSHEMATKLQELAGAAQRGFRSSRLVAAVLAWHEAVEADIGANSCEAATESARAEMARTWRAVCAARTELDAALKEYPYAR